MARKQAADYEQRREAIVEKAAELFAKRGFLGASIADLAQECRTSKSLVYHYYPSKEDILFTVMSSHVDALVEAAEAAVAASGSAAERLRRLVRDFMRLYVGAAARHKVLLNDLDNLPEQPRQTIVRQQRRVIELTEQLLVELEPKLAQKRENLRPVAMLFFGMINWTHTWFQPAGRVSPEQFADMAYAMLLHGISGVD